MDKQPQMRFWMWLGQNETLMKLLGQENWNEIIKYLEREDLKLLEVEVKKYMEFASQKYERNKENKLLEKASSNNLHWKKPSWEMLVVLINDDMKSESAAQGRKLRLESQKAQG